MKPDKILLIAAIVGILIIVFTTVAGPATYQATVISVYDGDTITVRLESGVVEKVRLIGIDAPKLRTNPWRRVLTFPWP